MAPDVRCSRAAAIARGGTLPADFLRLNLWRKKSSQMQRQYEERNEEPRGLESMAPGVRGLRAAAIARGGTPHAALKMYRNIVKISLAFWWGIV